MRDNFSQPIKDQLAQRTGYKCSNPFCRRTTIGPQQGSSGTVNIGEAAHIYAASKGGKRYNADMSEEQRKSYDNGIWMCRTHAAHIDRDEKYFTVEMLQKWKSHAEKSAANELLDNKENIKKCKFRMNLFAHDLNECKRFLELFNKQRGLLIDPSNLPVQREWEKHLEEISDLIGTELMVQIYNINRELDEFKKIMQIEIRRQAGMRLADNGTIAYCNRCDTFAERMKDWLTGEFMTTINFFADLNAEA